MKIQLKNKSNFKKEKYVLNLLLERGVPIENLPKLMTANFDNINDFKLLDNIDTGVALLKQQMREGKKIALIADCDVDGLTSAALFYAYMAKAYSTQEIEYFMHEQKQHGLSDMVDTLEKRANEFSLVVCPDSSSNDYEYHERLGAVGVPVLCLDHHDVEEKKFSHNAVIINNQLSPSYPDKELTGVGVTWQFCRALDAADKTDYANEFLDLVAVGLIGDMAPILEPEVFTLVQYGLHNVKNKLLKATLEKQSYSMGGEVTPVGIAFYICPLYNAMIRIGEMDQKRRLFEAFLDGDKMVPSHKRGAKGTMDFIKNEAIRECVNAKSKQNKLKEKFSEQLSDKLKAMASDNKILFTVLPKETELPQTMTGLLAMQIAAKYQRPTLVGRCYNNEIKGSIRGLNQSALTDMKTFLQKSDCFEYVQGHPQAAGFSIPKDNVDKVLDYANEKLKDVDFGETYYDVDFDREARADDLKDIITDIDNYKYLWGQQNDTPLIHVSNILVKRKDIKIMGRLQDTVKIECNGIAYMFFRSKDLIEKISLCSYDEFNISVVGTANINEFMGKTTPQIFVKDWQISDGKFSF